MTKLDLNLLRTFDALMIHRNVTRAANHLGLTQPAVSNALARLRVALDDPLFVRVQNGLQPTARAEEMIGGVRQGLLQLQNAIEPTSFDPQTAERRFTIAASSYFCALLMPALVEQLRREAPNISLRLVPASDMILSRLDQGAVDLALIPAHGLPTRIVAERLYRERLVWIASADNPIARHAMPMHMVDDASRIVIVPSRPSEAGGKPGEDGGLTAEQIEWEAGIPGGKRLAVYDSQTAVALVTRSDLVAQVPERLAALATAQGRIVVLDWPAESASYEMTMIWHARLRTDTGMTWLRGKLHEAVLKMPAGAA